MATYGPKNDYEVFDIKPFIDAATSYLKKLDEKAFDEVVKLGYEIRNEAITATPVKTGVLRAGWKVRQGRNQYAIWIEVSNTVPYATDIEYGTKPHLIIAKNAKVLANKRTGQFFGKTVHHPGTRPYPMLRPAITHQVPKFLKRLAGM